MSLSAALDVVLRYVPSVPYLLGKFKFTTDQAAPLTSPYTESGAVGSLTLVQTDGQLSTSGGKLQFPAQTTPAWGDLGAYGTTGLARQVGRAVLGTVNLSAWSSFGMLFGWGASAGASYTNIAGRALQLRSGNFAVVNNAATGPNVFDSPLSLATDYQLAVVARGTGLFLLTKGGTLANWTLEWVEETDTSATIRALFANGDAVGTLDDFRVADLPAPWNSDYGAATQRLAGARSAGDTGAHTANCLLGWTETTIPSAGTTDFRFRVQDASNYWQLTISSTGALTLNEVVAGTPTSRGSSAAAVANGNRVVVVADGSTIKVYVANTSKITYASASNFATATSFSLTALGTSEAISDIVAWPRTPAFPSAY